MRKFTTLFLLAFAMTIGTSQAFAQSNTGASNDNGKQESPGRDDGPEKDDDNEGNGGEISPRLLRVLPSADLVRLCTPEAPCRVPPRRPKPIKIKKETEGSGCEHKVMRVNGRLMPFIDCYKLVEVDGRMQLRYSRK